MRFYFGSVLQLLGKKTHLTNCCFCGKLMTRDRSFPLHYCPGSPAAKVFRIPVCSDVARWVPQNLSYVLVGGERSGKSLWMYMLLDYYLKKGIRSSLITIDDPWSEVKSTAETYVDGLKSHQSKGELIVVDSHSMLQGTQAEDGRLEETNLKNFDETVAGLLQQKVRALFLDSATPLFAGRDDRSVLSFLSKTSWRVKGKSGTFFFSMSPELMRNTVKATLPHFVDTLLEFRHPEAKTTATSGDLGLTGWIRGKPRDSSPSLAPYLRELRISKTRGNKLYNGWIPFIVGETGVFLALPTEPEENQLLWQEVKRTVGALHNHPAETG